MDKPIPAFYACYLLRSTVRHSSLYVGSTPNPVRRLKQHNGEAKGGAVRTSRDSLRPWEMACLVTGFPSKIAALQFEWAWQNPHLTRHLLPTARLTTTKSPSKKTSARSRRARPRLTLTDRLANLHLLLRSPSFARWPLTLTFYAGDVHKAWERWRKSHPETLSDRVDGLDVRIDDSATPNSHLDQFPDEAGEPQPRGIQALDVSYTPLKPHLSKSRSLLPSTSTTHSKPPDCSICHTALPESGASTLICPHETCTSTTHITCLATHFLSNHDDTNGTAALMPKTGNCPGCKTELHWVDLVRELSLRMRGEKEIAALFKEKRKRRTKDGGKGKDAVQESEESAEDESDEVVGVLGEDDGWHHLSESSEGEAEEVGVGLGRNGFKLPRMGVLGQARAGAAKPEPVVEDSEWDDAEIIV